MTTGFRRVVRALRLEAERKKAPPFRVRLAGLPEEIELMAEILRVRYGATPHIRRRSSRRAELRCDVPQEHAHAVMMLIRGKA